MKPFCFAGLALLAVTPAMSAPTTFWPFGFYFPNKAHSHAGGLSRLDHDTAPHTPATVQLADLDTPSLQQSYQRGAVTDGHARILRGSKGTF